MSMIPVAVSGMGGGWGGLGDVIHLIVQRTSSGYTSQGGIYDIDIAGASEFQVIQTTNGGGNYNVLTLGIDGIATEYRNVVTGQKIPINGSVMSVNLRAYGADYDLKFTIN